MWVDPTGMVEQWWEDMLRSPHWRQVFLDSATRHNFQNITNLDDNGFAAVLASITLIEGGNIGGASGGVKGTVGRLVGPLPEDLRIQIVSCVKFGEILYNEWLDLQRYSTVSSLELYHQTLVEMGYETGNIEEKLEYQTEGIVNIDHNVKTQIKQYGIDTYDYPFFYYDGIPGQIGGVPSDRAAVWRGHEQWIEYLAASFEIVQKQAQELNIDLTFYGDDEYPESIRAFAQWHKSGIVEVFSFDQYGDQILGAWYGKESLQKADQDWAEQHRKAQLETDLYYDKVKEYFWPALTGLTDVP